MSRKKLEEKAYKKAIVDMDIIFYFDCSDLDILRTVKETDTETLLNYIKD